ncbi:MAG: outer membrane protein assembly factor BamA [Pseudomonadota bacterium]
MQNSPRYRSILSAAVWTLLLANSYGVPANAAAKPASKEAKPAPESPSSIAGVGAVRIEGNQRVESSTILSYLGVRSGSQLTQSDIDGSLKNLYATGFFSDVKLLKSGNALVVRVVENPIVNKVAFEGNSTIETEDLEKEMGLKARSVYSRDKLQADVKRIIDIYRRSGRYNAVVEPKTIAQDQNRVDLVYEITEGATAHVEKINFVGNKKFSDSDLRKAVRTEETRWYKFFSDSDKYDPDRLQFDQELLRRYYINEGYADFQVKSAHAELSPKKDAFYITFVVEEGVQYKFGEVKVTSELKNGEKPDFSDLIASKSGKIYNAGKVEESIDAMTKRLGDLGYAFVDIQPKLERDTPKQLANLTYVIKPGPRVYVERINVTGNVRTLDEVIRREFRVSEGDAYNNSKLQRSEQRLNNLGFFEKVDIKNEQGSAPDKTVVNVDVKEKSTGEVSIGAGFSTTDGILGDFGVSEKNLLGRGQELRTRLTLAARRKQIELGFTEPYFLNRDIAAGFDIYRTKQDFLAQSSYNMDTKGFNLRSSYALQEKLQHSINYTLRENNVTDVTPEASIFIKQQVGTNVNSAISQSFAYDDRNNKLDPSSGYYMRITQEFAGLGGDSRYLKHDLKASYYYPITAKWRTSFIASSGYIFGMGGRDVRINDRFFVGGDDLRGFRNAGIGPRDTATRDALGGNAYYTGTAELKFPLGLPEELGVSGAVFSDVGSLWKIDNSSVGVSQHNAVRASAGVGVLWTSPFGPIRVDFAHAFAKQDEDMTETMRFSFGTRF